MILLILAATLAIFVLVGVLRWPGIIAAPVVVAVLMASLALNDYHPGWLL